MYIQLDFIHEMEVMVMGVMVTGVMAMPQGNKEDRVVSLSWRVLESHAESLARQPHISLHLFLDLYLFLDPSLSLDIYL